MLWQYSYPSTHRRPWISAISARTWSHCFNWKLFDSNWLHSIKKISFQLPIVAFDLLIWSHESDRELLDLLIHYALLESIVYFVDEMKFGIFSQNCNSIEHKCKWKRNGLSYFHFYSTFTNDLFHEQITCGSSNLHSALVQNDRNLFSSFTSEFIFLNNSKNKQSVKRFIFDN